MAVAQWLPQGPQVSRTKHSTIAHQPLPPCHVDAQQDIRVGTRVDVVQMMQLLMTERMHVTRSLLLK